MRSCSKFVSLLHFKSRKKENLFLVKRKMAFQNLSSLPIICSEIQELYLWKNANRKPTMTFWVSQKAVSHPLSQSSSLPCSLCTFRTPPPLLPGPERWGIRTGRTASWEIWLCQSLLRTWLQWLTLLLLHPSPLPSPTTHFMCKKILSLPYLKLSSTLLSLLISSLLLPNLTL